ncbi:MAG: PTS sugar transporter subunit IIA [Deltaproteobacteria bacterium]|nr:PTS sugar transporter subunit IIA [Deltaproteobacteria bacterium]
MRLRDYMRPELVLQGVDGEDRRAVLCAMAAESARVLGLDGDAVCDRLLEREKCAATGLEGGVAVPHATIEGIEGTALIVARLARPVDFGALDGKPVDIVFMLLSAPERIMIHIRLLARIARLCSGKVLLDAIRGAEDAASLWRAVEQEDARHV